MTPRILNGQARGFLDEVNGWLDVLERGGVVTAKPGGVDREWIARDEVLKRIRAARARLDQIEALLGCAS